MNVSSLRLAFLRLAIAFLGCSALVAIGVVLSGEMGELQGRILASSGTISAASICAMACAAFLERRGMRAPALAGIALAGATAAAVLVGIWAKVGADAYWRGVGIAATWTVSVAHTELLWLPSLAPAHRWVQVTATTAIATLAGLGTWAILREPDSEFLGRIFAVLAILVALHTLVIPILWKLRGAVAASTADELVLSRVADQVYADAAGNRYTVHRLGAPPHA